MLWGTLEAREYQVVSPIGRGRASDGVMLAAWASQVCRRIREEIIQGDVGTNVGMLVPWCILGVEKLHCRGPLADAEFMMDSGVQVHGA